ncbi:hypothetical protein SAMN05661008_00880 [Alkalithermobacter thermoalcaliphilus JW-YL-7 = DSM 7308]|uniref:Uncharacterized protein n=1 Tax=Alkalithermobacter thermoalcaliphilus JW-YL-7 = DSM 7308 TaxID=1121328 RepID=A0A150FQM7_CLOPD|nr:hypothetical protein JWYL7_0973 [[Clostridium] paradoxum JW-YL-7 = DSM 7308]SHK78208.1 hypothetical protein SAMN05661008_00880 [[Clostridium] paradoxum JW-YL-7 = DSM 7308]
MDNLSVVSIRVDQRTDSATKLQEVLTKNGDMILARFGMHDPQEINTGLITLNIRGEKSRINNMLNELSSLDGIKVNHMEA